MLKQEKGNGRVKIWKVVAIVTVVSVVAVLAAASAHNQFEQLMLNGTFAGPYYVTTNSNNSYNAIQATNCTLFVEYDGMYCLQVTFQYQPSSNFNFTSAYYFFDSD